MRGFESKERGGFMWKDGSIRVMDRGMDRDCIDRWTRKRREEGKRIFREK